MELTARRVTVVGPHRRIDLALPAQSPIAELVPQLVRMAGIAAYPAAPAGWVLSRLGSSPLEGATTVATAGICDGEVLYLNPAETAPAPMLFDDVVDAIARAVEVRPGVWRPEVSRRVGAAVAGLVFGGIATLIGAAGLGWPATTIGGPATTTGAGPVLAGVLAVLLLVIGGAVARSYGDSLVAAALVAGGLPAALVAGLQSVSGAGLAWSAAASLGVGFAAVAVYAVLAAVVISDRAAWFVPAAVAAAIGGLAAAAAVDLAVRPPAIAALVIVTVIALSPVLPSVALRLGRLPLPRVPSDVAAFRRDEKPTLGPEVGRDTRVAEDALTALLGALAVTVAGATVVVLLGGATWGCGLAGAAGLVLLLRARAYVGTGQRAVLLLGGAAALVGAGVRLAGTGDSRVWLGLIGASALIGVVCAISAVRAPGRSPSPYWSRLLDVAEFLALISLVPTAAAVMGVYSAIRAWVG
jgi:type VII secretion integral membrane protein EccD